MRLLSWNVKGIRGSRAVGEQIRVVIEREPDVVALQEVTERSCDCWIERLRAAGYEHVVSGRELCGRPYPAPEYPPDVRTGAQIHRLYFNLIASRSPLVERRGLTFPDRDEEKLAFPEKHVAASIAMGGTMVALHNTHLPPGVSRGVLKVHAFEAIRRRMDEEDGPTILCGDFNAPQYEDDSGPLPSGLRARDAKPPQDPLSIRWAKAEAGVIENPNLRDAYRDVHPAGAPFPASYYTRGAAKGIGPRRYDLVLVSRHFRTKSCRYHDEWLRSRLSDHAAVEVVLVLEP